MKLVRPLIGIGLLGLGWFATAAEPEANVRPSPTPVPAEVSPTVTPRQRVGRVILPEKAPVGSLNVSAGAVRPVLDPLPPEVKDRVRTFDQYRAEYLKRQEEIRKQAVGTTDQDREKIRERFKELRERWREQSVATREELRERRKELLERLPSHRELLEDAREQNRDALRDRRERRGVDN